MKVAKNLVTQNGLKLLKDELKHLTTIIRKRIADDIQKAKEFGDLSENAAYASAIEARDLNESRIAELEDMINNAKVISASDKSAGNGTITIGDTVVLKPENGDEITITVVGVGESDPINHKIASDTPLANAILGKKVNSKVIVDLPGGKFNYEILKVK